MDERGSWYLSSSDMMWTLLKGRVENVERVEMVAQNLTVYRLNLSVSVWTLRRASAADPDANFRIFKFSIFKEFRNLKVKR